MKRKVLLLSIKPEYAIRILNGDKRIELRKTSPKVEFNDIIVIYATAPTKAIVGYCKVRDIVRDSPKRLWLNYGSIAGIERKDFNTYYDQRDFGVGILLKDVRALNNKMKLCEIRKFLPSFNPPQSFAYLSRTDVYSTLRYRLRAA